MSEPAYLLNRAALHSRYALTEVHIDDFVSPGRRRYGLWIQPEIDMTNYDRYVVTASDLMRPDLIAWKFYKNVNYWPFIMLVNNISNPFTGMTVGLVLKVPRKAEIEKALIQSA